MSVRTCLVTGKKENPKNLFRFTVQNGVLIFDKSFRKKHPGKGGYVIKSEQALEKLKFLSKKVAYFLKEERVLIEEKVIEEQKKLIMRITK